MALRLPPGMRDVVEQLADPASGLWEEIGYDPFPLSGPPPAAAAARPAAIAFEAVASRYDVVVVGSGAGGGVAARVLAEAGASVLVVERGSWVDREGSTFDHLNNHRMPVLGNGASPAGHPRVVVSPDGHEQVIDDPSDFAYENNAIAVGGGTRLFGAQAWRFDPDDFRMATRYGVPDGSALADWPIGYDDLEPYYATVERELGVAGEHGSGCPMEVFPLGTEGERLADAASRLGWSTERVPLLVNTVPRDGRPACVRCGCCVGFPCPVDAKNGTDVAALPKAVAAGAQLVEGVQVTSVADDGTVELTGGGERRAVRAGRIVLAAGAIETARLLLVSRLGNDWVGDCLQGHTYAGALGRFDDDVADRLGPGPSIATRDFTHGNEGVVGGGLLADEFVKPPTIFYLLGLPRDAPREGQAAIDEVRRWYRRTSHVWGPVQEIPTRRARVRLAGTVDANGVPVARLEGTQHPEDVRTAAVLADRAQEWLVEAGAARTWRFEPRRPALSADQHQAGTARMSDSHHHGVTDPHGRVWGTERVYVADASVHVTNGGANPVLTIMALAWRTAEHVAALG